MPATSTIGLRRPPPAQWCWVRQTLRTPPGVWIEEVVNDNYTLRVNEGWQFNSTRINAMRFSDNGVSASQLTLAIHQRDSLGVQRTDSIFFNAALREEASDDRCCDVVNIFEFNRFDHTFAPANARGDVDLSPGVSSERSFVRAEFAIR